MADLDVEQNMHDGVDHFFKLYTFNTNIDDNPLLGSIHHRVHINGFVSWMSILRDKMIVVVGHMICHQCYNWDTIQTKYRSTIAGSCTSKRIFVYFEKQGSSTKNIIYEISSGL